MRIQVRGMARASKLTKPKEPERELLPPWYVAADKLHFEGTTALENGDPDTAKKCLYEALREMLSHEHPQSASVMADIMLLHLGLEEQDTALHMAEHREAFIERFKQWPALVNAVLDRARLLGHMAEAEEDSEASSDFQFRSLKAFEEALELCNKHEVCLLMMMILFACSLSK
jgi:hypothetical protein